VSHKQAKIESIIRPFMGRGRDPHYLAFFDCFNRQLYFEAHEVLEEIWLPQRHGPKGRFYKGLIQLAGAFVHLQKGRPGPAAALFNLAQSNLEHYQPIQEGLDLGPVLALIQHWLLKLAAGTSQPGMADTSAHQIAQPPCPGSWAIKREAGAGGEPSRLPANLLASADPAELLLIGAVD
jgi:predicted metal-dependent hydrolase